MVAKLRTTSPAYASGGVPGPCEIWPRAFARPFRCRYDDGRCGARLLFDSDRSFTTFEIAPGFLMIMNDEATEQMPTRVIVNWAALIDGKR